MPDLRGKICIHRHIGGEICIHRHIIGHVPPMAERIIIEPLTVTADGIYTADNGRAYSPVTVTIEQGVYAQLLEETWDS